jgi:hypothetical protein
MQDEEKKTIITYKRGIAKIGPSELQRGHWYSTVH